MIRDNQLQRAVLEELSWEPSVASAHLGVTADAGVVALTGHVQSYAEKHAAKTAASRVKGVKAVADEIEVRLPVETLRSDEEIAGAAINRLEWDVSVPRDAVQVRVEKGWLTLTGEVDWNFQREAAVQDVRRMFGVVQVSNEITISLKVNSMNISENIARAMHRSCYFEPRAITVSAEGGTVTLTGSVDSPLDRQGAAFAAWGASGVTAVKNHIAIN